MSPMNPLAELDQLNLEPAAKTHVAAMIQALLEQAALDAQSMQNGVQNFPGSWGKER